MGRFRDALAGPGLAGIAEIKRRSPSAGELRPDADPSALAAAFAGAGAAAVSVLVDERFAGSLADLAAARSASGVPLLAKGFFSTEQDLDDLRAAGADAALLILRDLDDRTVARLIEHATRIGLDTLVEAHDAAELARAVALGADPIGINARDLATFAIDREAQLRLVAEAPRDRVVVAESAVHTRAQGAAAELAGADAVLIGSALMRAADPPAKLREILSRPLVKVCGLTREEDVEVALEAGADLCGFILEPASPRAAERVLPVPDTALSVAVFVGEPDEAEADLVQLYEREEGAVRGRDAVLLREGRQVATVVDLPWDGDDPTLLERARAVDGRVVLAGGLGPDNVAARGRCRAAVGRRRELEPGGRARDQGSRPRAGVRGGGQMSYGEYGGRYVPETLIPALDELDAGWRDAQADATFAAELDRLGREYGGRPTPLTLAERFAPGKRLYLKREDLLHTGRAQAEQRARPGGAGAAAGQAAHRRRDRSGAARRRDRDRLRALRARVRRLHGRRGHAAPAAERRADGPARRRGAPGRVRDEDPEGGDQRGDPRLDHERRDDPLSDRLVRRTGAVPRDRPRAPGRDRPRGARADPRGRGPAAGCRRSPASAAARTRSGCSPASWTTGTSASTASRRPGAASLGTGRPGVLHGARSSLLADEDGQIVDAHSISAGLDYPGVGPEHA